MRSSRSNFWALIVIVVVIVLIAVGVWYFFPSIDKTGWLYVAACEAGSIVIGIVLGWIVTLIMRPLWLDPRRNRAGLESYVGKTMVTRVADGKATPRQEMAAEYFMTNVMPKKHPHTAAEHHKITGTGAAVGSSKPSQPDATAALEQMKDVPDEKILQPEYAIGQGLITRPEYDALQAEFLAQSDLTAGLIFPLALLLFAVEVNPQSFKAPFNVWVLAGLAGVTAMLLFFGLERRQKYRVELQSLILGRWDKLQKAKQQDPPPKPTTQSTSFEKTVEEKVAKLDSKGAKLEVQESRTITEKWTKTEDPPKPKTTDSTKTKADSSKTESDSKTPPPKDPKSTQDDES